MEESDEKKAEDMEQQVERSEEKDSELMQQKTEESREERKEKKKKKKRKMKKNNQVASETPIPSPAVYVLPPIRAPGESSRMLAMGGPAGRTPLEPLTEPNNQGTANANLGEQTYINEDRIEMEMFRTDHRELPFHSKGASSNRYGTSAPTSARKPWTKRPAFISALIFACLAVAGMVVGVLVVTGVINTGGPLSSGNLHGTNTTSDTTPQPRPLVIMVDGSWTTWTAWQACDVTCGGGVQRRTRACTNPPPADGGLDCAGRDEQARPCSDWKCPNCSRVCTVGTLNAACDACMCDNHVLDGSVTDTRNAPLDGAEIYLAEKPWEVASTTNSTGRFALAGACSQGTLILVRRGGYFEEYANSTQLGNETSSVAVKMRVMGPPVMEENPVRKVRLVRQDVTFCCRARGTPMPSYYEWFKDDRVLDEDVYRYNETLTLYDLQEEDSGVYKCRANSDAGAKYSKGALLTVYDNGTPMCDSTPANKLIDLPNDCVQPDTSTARYDIGTCSRQKCAGDLGGDDKSCLDNKKFCCSPVASATRTVQCSDYSLDVTVTTSCGCGECVELTKRVSGRAFGMQNGTEIPLDQGDIIMDGEIQGYTSQTGEFELNVPLTVDQVTVTFKDFYKSLVTTTKVLPVEEGIEPYYTVRMQVRPPAIPLNASETNTISLGTLPGQPPVAEVDIPPNSFFTENGDPYTGTVQASVGFIDPRNPDDFDAIQSDLTTVDEEGTQQALRTFGMFSMDFEDDVGNPVVMGGKMTMQIDPQQVNIDPGDVDENGNLNCKLWSMNPRSGEWELVGNLRTGTASRRGKRQETFIIGEFEYQGYPINCDKRETTDRRCWVKVRVYKDEDAAKNAKESDQERGAQAIVLTVDTPDYTSSWWGSSSGLSRYQTLTVGANGACVETFCEPTGREFNASVLVSHGNRTLKPLNVRDQPHPTKWPTDLENSVEHNDDPRFPIISFDVFKPTASDNGPLYTQQSLCNAAPIEHNHIAFYNTEYEPYIFPPYVFDEAQYNEPINELSWYNREDSNKTVCFIKVKVSFNRPNGKVEIRTKSEGGGGYPDNTGKVYGIRDDEIDLGNSSTGFGCLEFKCPGPVMTSPGDGMPPRRLHGNPEDTVLLTVQAKTARCYYQRSNNLFRTAYDYRDSKAANFTTNPVTGTTDDTSGTTTNTTTARATATNPTTDYTAATYETTDTPASPTAYRSTLYTGPTWPWQWTFPNRPNGISPATYTGIEFVSAGNNHVKIRLPTGTDFSGVPGIYMKQGEKKVGYNAAHEYCMKGTETPGAPDSMVNWGVEFYCLS
ncbi:PREDICTED: cartilage intermediate layer protein 1-like [Branchiostoma belcheri]|uniref:Cartilage intermediate layer protein 1-like n=1 Tax=Branchiostoma belcheri TaxID=7741 RepID=A0A6P5ADB1_BRABE|nr:PREDICTED: cartilage intermediate layer protein 1-like [Branchiostoma belcheri]